jgi:predicted nucleic-acid-binding protein
MLGVDTNVLVRYLMQDHPEQSGEATGLIEGAQAEGEGLFLSSPVLCELAWVLQRGYRFPRSEIVRVLETLLHVRSFVFDHKDLVIRALERYRAGPAGFADYLIVQHAWRAECARFLTFDKDLAASLGTRR